MIVVFVVDTSPSMGLPASSKITKGNRGGGMSRLDLAKMAVESLSKGLDRRIQEHNRQMQQDSSVNNGNAGNVRQPPCPPDQFLLLSTGRQDCDQPGTAACGAGGRLLVGYGDSFVHRYPQQQAAQQQQHLTGENEKYVAQHAHNHGGFERELKRLKSTVLPQLSAGSTPSTALPKFPEDGGGAIGLNAALSAGLQLLHRYRLRYRSTENFGMGRPMAIGSTASGSGALAGTGVGSALQPACLILLTDAECLTRSPSEGGGELQLQFGNMPLREFYREPFRWDQRLFCIQIGAGGNAGGGTVPSKKTTLPSALRALCEVTGGGHFSIRSSSNLSQTSEQLLRRMAPPRPRVLPVPDPLRLPSLPPPRRPEQGSSVFLNGGPVCTFQPLERGPNGEAGPVHRAMLLHVPYQNSMLQQKQQQSTITMMTTTPPPLWCLPESFWPSKKLDTLPPRLAQPLLQYSRHYHQTVTMSHSFDPVALMKALHRLDQLVSSNRQATAAGATSGGLQHHQQQPVKLLQRDVYICEWLGKGGDSKSLLTSTLRPQSQRGHEHFPLCVRGAGRPSLSEGGESENWLHMGILHVPSDDTGSSGKQNSTVTILPPEPHILLPLLVRAAEAEYRVIKKATAEALAKEAPSATGGSCGSTTGIIQRGAAGGSGAAMGTTGSGNVQVLSKNVFLDEAWRNEFRGYLFRVPPYYQGQLRRALRPILPQSAHSLLSNDSVEGIASLCFSRVCLQKIRNGEQLVKEMNQRMERQEEEYRRRGVQPAALEQQQQRDHAVDSGSGGIGTVDAGVIGYGQYDPRASVSSYLAALRLMPPPWKVRGMKGDEMGKKDGAACKKDSKTKDSSNTSLTSSGVAATMTKGANVCMGSKSIGVKRPLSSNLSDTRGGSPTERDEQIEKQVMVTEVLGDLPSKCLLAYYESRRRWIYGGCGLTTKCLSVEGVCNDGSSTHKYSAKYNVDADETLLSIAGVGASMTNQYSIRKMGDYRERLLWSRSPVVGYGCNDSSYSGSAATTQMDGSPLWSVDDGALPSSFFDARTGQFRDSMQARVATRLQINFGNPFNDERGSSIVPEKFQHQRPPQHHGAYDGDEDSEESSPRTPPGSPPHDAFSSSMEGEGEAVFAGKKPTSGTATRKSSSISSNIPLLTHRSKRSRVSSGENHRTSSKGTVRHPPEGSPGGKTKPTPPPLPSSKQKPPPPPPAMRKPPPPLTPAPPTESVGLSAKGAISSNPLSGGRTIVVASACISPGKQMADNKQVQQPSPQMQKKRPIDQQRKQQQQQQPPPLPIMDMQDPTKKPKVSLPPGWMCVWSKSQKRWYFFDTRTNKSVWQWPPPGGLPR